jgi:hypothetical protein
MDIYTTVRIWAISFIVIFLVIYITIVNNRSVRYERFAKSRGYEYVSNPRADFLKNENTSYIRKYKLKSVSDFFEGKVRGQDFKCFKFTGSLVKSKRKIKLPKGYIHADRFSCLLIKLKKNHQHTIIRRKLDAEDLIVRIVKVIFFIPNKITGKKYPTDYIHHDEQDKNFDKTHLIYSKEKNIAEKLLNFDVKHYLKKYRLNLEIENGYLLIYSDIKRFFTFRNLFMIIDGSRVILRVLDDNDF